MTKKEKTIEELAKQDLKSLAKKYVEGEKDTKEFVEKAESFDTILKRVLKEKELQDVLKECVCFAVVGATKKSTGVHEICFKFGSKEAIQQDFMETLFQSKLKEKIGDLTKDIQKGLNNNENTLLKDNIKITGRA